MYVCVLVCVCVCVCACVFFRKKGTDKSPFVNGEQGEESLGKKMCVPTAQVDNGYLQLSFRVRLLFHRGSFSLFVTASIHRVNLLGR